MKTLKGRKPMHPDLASKRILPGRPLSSIYDLYLSGDITSPDQYIEWFDLIRGCGPHDVIRLYINSGGGDVFTAIQFRSAMALSQATILVEVEGACMSAATMIMLASDSIEVADDSMFMFHNYSGGCFGKGGEMYDNIIHERQWSEKLLRNVYEHFLDDDEITQILASKDIWMDASEVRDRLKLRGEILEEIEKAREAEEAAKAKAEEAAKENETPKPPKRKRKSPVKVKEVEGDGVWGTEGEV